MYLDKIEEDESDEMMLHGEKSCRVQGKAEMTSLFSSNRKVTFISVEILSLTVAFCSSEFCYLRLFVLRII